jgi:phosphatidylglycerol lysyltransferase
MPSKGIKFLLISIIGLVLLGIAIVVLVHKLKAISLSMVITDIRSMPPWRTGLALLLTAIEYSVLTGYDYFGLRYAGCRLPYHKVAAVTTIADTFNHTIGFTAILGSSMKFRYYSLLGVRPGEIIKAIGIYTFSYWIGFLTIGGCALILGSFGIGGPLSLSSGTARLLAIAFFSLLSVYLGLVFFYRHSWRIGKRTIDMPSPPLALALLGVAITDWLLAGTVFFILMPPIAGVSYAGVMTAFLIAALSGIVSQVPGGMAVFESVAILMLGKDVPLVSLSASLLVFRGLFYLVPFSCASLLMLYAEIRIARQALRKIRPGAVKVRNDGQANSR